MKVVTKRTGLSPHVLRAWEKRYAAIEPDRSGTNRRLYSEEEIQRLTLLAQLTRSGHSIGTIAALPANELRKLAGVSASEPISPAPAKRGFLSDAIAAVKKLDAPTLEATLHEASIDLGAQGTLQHLVAPLATEIGELWREGELTAAHEHFATAVIRSFLSHATSSFAGAEHAPTIVIGTLIGQLHELGALLAAATAANLGWRVVYLGASLPAAEIAGAARQSSARAVALSFVYPDDDPRVRSELQRLRHAIGDETAIVVGGRSASSYAADLKAVKAAIAPTLKDLSKKLDDVRKARAAD